jgi:hypothetical protein
MAYVITFTGREYANIECQRTCNMRLRKVPHFYHKRVFAYNEDVKIYGGWSAFIIPYLNESRAGPVRVHVRVIYINGFSMCSQSLWTSRNMYMPMCIRTTSGISHAMLLKHTICSNAHGRYIIRDLNSRRVARRLTHELSPTCALSDFQLIQNTIQNHWTIPEPIGWSFDAEQLSQTDLQLIFTNAMCQLIGDGVSDHPDISCVSGVMLM